MERYKSKSINIVTERTAVSIAGKTNYGITDVCSTYEEVQTNVSNPRYFYDIAPIVHGEFILQLDMTEFLGKYLY